MDMIIVGSKFYKINKDSVVNRFPCSPITNAIVKKQPLIFEEETVMPFNKIISFLETEDYEILKGHVQRSMWWLCGMQSLEGPSVTEISTQVVKYITSISTEQIVDELLGEVKQPTQVVELACGPTEQDVDNLLREVKQSTQVSSNEEHKGKRKRTDRPDSRDGKQCKQNDKHTVLKKVKLEEGEIEDRKIIPVTDTQYKFVMEEIERIRERRDRYKAIVCGNRSNQKALKIYGDLKDQLHIFDVIIRSPRHAVVYHKKDNVSVIFRKLVTCYNATVNVEFWRSHVNVYSIKIGDNIFTEDRRAIYDRDKLSTEKLDDRSAIDKFLGSIGMLTIKNRYEFYKHISRCSKDGLDEHCTISITMIVKNF